MAGTTFTIVLDADTHLALMKVQAAFAALKQFAALAIGAAGGGGFVALAESSMTFADAMKRAAVVAGTTVPEMAGIGLSAAKDEIELGTLRQGLKALSENLVKSGQGSRNLKEALLDQARALSEMEPGAQRNALATEKFGKAGLSLLPWLEQGPVQLERMFQEQTRLAGITEASAVTAHEWKDSIQDLKTAAEGFAGALAVQVLPRLSQFIRAITEGLVRLREWTRESQAFKTGVETVGVGISVATGYLVLAKAAGGLAAIFGPLRSLQDLIAALRLLPGVLAATAAAAAPFAISLLSATAVVVGLIEAVKMFNSFKIESRSAADLARTNMDLAASIRKVIDERERLGELDAADAKRLRSKVDVAMLHPEMADRFLAPIGKQLIAKNPAAERPRFMTRDDLDLANKELDIERSIETIRRERLDLANLGPRQIRDEERLKSLHVEENLLAAKRKNIDDALAQGAITKKESAELQLHAEKELLSVDREIAQLDMNGRAALKGKIAADFRLTDAQKFEQTKLLSTGDERDLQGPDPSNMVQQFQAQRSAFLNSIGTDAQNLANLAMSPFKGLFDGLQSSIQGLIRGTMTWGDALRNVGTTIVSSIIESFARLAAEWLTTHVVMGAISEVFRTTETASAAAHTTAQVGIHAAGEGAKTGSTFLGSIARGAIRLGETLWHGLLTGIKVAAHIAGEIAMTAATIVQAAIRGAALLAEAVVWLIKAAFSAANSVADVPYVGPILAIAAMAAIIAAGVGLMGGFKKGGYTGDGPSNQVAGPVHRKEYVLDEHTTARTGTAALDDLRRGKAEIRPVGSGGQSDLLAARNLAMFLKPDDAGSFGGRRSEVGGPKPQARLTIRASRGGASSSSSSPGQRVLDNTIRVNNAMQAILTSKEIRGFAQGGRPELGRASMVGEHGPELFVPDRPGTVISNQHVGEFLASARGGAIAQDGARTGAARQAGNAASSPPAKMPDINIGVLNDRGDIPNWVRSREGEAYVLDLVRKNWHRLS